MTDTTHKAPDKMKTIRLTVDLTYDQEVMHGDDEEAIAWFDSILAGNDLMLGDFGELGDMIGSVKVVTQQDDLVQQDDDDFRPATAGDDPIWLGGVEYITKSRSDELVQAAVAAKLTEAAEVVRCSDFRHEAHDNILALITPDAQAALDRVVAAKLREAADTVEDYCSDAPDLAGHGHSVGIRDAIFALIREGGE